jgi:hypothetical protein
VFFIKDGVMSALPPVHVSRIDTSEQAETTTNCSASSRHCFYCAIVLHDSFEPIDIAGFSTCPRVEKVVYILIFVSNWVVWVPILISIRAEKTLEP